MIRVEHVERTVYRKIDKATLQTTNLCATVAATRNDVGFEVVTADYDYPSGQIFEAADLRELAAFANRLADNLDGLGE